MKTNNFFKKLMKELTKTPPRRPLYHYPTPLYQIILLLLLLVLLIIYTYHPYIYNKVEGLKSDSFWCKYFSWFPGVSCDDPAPAAAAAAASTAAPAASTAATAASGSSGSSSTPAEPELDDCNCNANCELKDESDDRVLDDECKIPEGLENVTNVNGYCDKCYDIVDKDCRLNLTNPTKDPVVMADIWCGGNKKTGANVLERCTGESGNTVVGGESVWRGLTYEKAYPQVLVNYMVESADFSGEGGKCEDNMDSKLRWTKFEPPHPN